MTSYDDKLKSFTTYLRSVLKDVVPSEVLEEMSDDDLMEAERKNPETGDDFFSKEQERHIIMECGSNESIIDAFSNLKHLSHLEEKEKQLLEEFSCNLKTITVEKNGSVLNILKRLKKYSKDVTVKDLDSILEIICSMYPGWVLEGDKYTIVEEEPLQFSLDGEDICVGCLLDESMHDYKTFFGWAKNNYTGGIYEGDDFDDIETDMLETYNMKAKDALVDMVTALFTMKYEKPDNFFEDIEQNNHYNDLFFELCEELWRYLMVVPLVSCWMYGKDSAQKSIDQKKEAFEILDGIHDQFETIYQECLKTKDYKPFIQGLKNYLHQFDKSQLLLISRFGLPFDMSQTLENKLDKILIKELQAKLSSEE